METYPQNWPAVDTAFRIDAVDLEVLPGPHPLEAAHSDAIAAHWAQEYTANPHLFNGRMLLQRRLGFDGGRITGQGHVVSYAAYLWWRKREDAAGALHLFAFAVPVSSDGAVIAIRMADTTANPGLVYCAGGSLDPDDIIDGTRVDVAGNMRREVLEETGLDLAGAEAGPQLFATHSRRRFLVFRYFHFSRTADDILAGIRAHMAQDEEQEIAGAVAIRSPDRNAHAYSPFMFPVLDTFFGRAGG